MHGHLNVKAELYFKYKNLYLFIYLSDCSIPLTTNLKKIRN